MKDRRRNRLCPVTRKVQYKNAGEAKRQIAWFDHNSGLPEHGLIAQTQATYRCRHCNKWHITSMSPEQSKRFEQRVVTVKGSA